MRQCSTLCTYSILNKGTRKLHKKNGLTADAIYSYGHYIIAHFSYVGGWVVV